MKKIALILTWVLFSITLSTQGQDKFLKDETAVNNLSKKVSNLFKINKISDAFGELRQYWPLPESEFEEIKQKTIKYINIIEGRFGQSRGVVRTREEKIQDFAIRETYMVKYNLSAIRIIFTYYKSKDGWIVNAFKWDDSFSEEFKGEK